MNESKKQHCVFRFGIGNTRTVHFEQGDTIGKLILDTDLAEQMGFDPDRIRILLNRKPLELKDVAIPDSTIDIEARGTHKSGFALPKQNKCERWLRTQGCQFEGSGPGDHKVWRVKGERVQLNYRRGELDIASFKAIARALQLKPYEVLQGMRTA